MIKRGKRVAKVTVEIDVDGKSNIYDEICNVISHKLSDDSLITVKDKNKDRCIFDIFENKETHKTFNGVTGGNYNANISTKS